jgi:3-phenylpropionate/cinnamic acid dioxygenase small subunit
VEAFLFEEADAADRHAYREWLALWAEDGCYWLPCNDDDADPATHVALIYETYAGLEDRVRRLSTGYAHTQSPATRLVRVIGNIRVAGIDNGLVEAKSVFNLTAFRRNVMETFAARVVHHLRPAGDSFRIVRKTVYLVNNDGYMNNMTFLI